MPLNPLDLFTSETNKEDRNKRRLSSIYRQSSPIQETQVIKELKLQEEHERLLAVRVKLKEDVHSLENEWNELQSAVEAKLLNDQTEEDELIYQLLLQKSNELEQEAENVSEDIIQEQDPDLVPFNPEKFSTAPLKDWDLRIEFLKKFYPYLSVVEPSSRVLLEYDSNDKPKLFKLISFNLFYGKLFRFHVDIKLNNEQDEYSIVNLRIAKLSNNQFNTILNQIIGYYMKTKNISEFLYCINELYEMLIERKKSLEELQKEYYPDSKQSRSLALSPGTFEINDIQLSWDILFDETLGNLDYLILINSEYNTLFLDMMKLYGLNRAISNLLETLYKA